MRPLVARSYSNHWVLRFEPSHVEPIVDMHPIQKPAFLRVPRKDYGHVVSRKRLYILLVREELMMKAAKANFAVFCEKICGELRCEPDVCWLLAIVFAKPNQPIVLGSCGGQSWGSIAKEGSLAREESPSSAGGDGAALEPEEALFLCQVP